jgi:hypothetical protein
MFRAQTSNNAIQLVGCSLLAVASLLLASSTPLFGQEPRPSPGPSGETVRNATHVLGLENVKRGAKGRLAIVDNALRFEVATGTADVSITSIQDVFTGQDSKQMGGKPGTKQVTSAGLAATPRALTAHSKAHIPALPAFGRGCLSAHLGTTLTSQSLINMFVWHSSCTPLRGWNDVGVEMQVSANALIVSLKALGPTTASHHHSHQWTYALEVLV